MYPAKTGTDVHYEITPRTQQSISQWFYSASLEASSFLFPSCLRKGQTISYSFYRSVIMCWAVKLEMNADYYGTSFNASHQSYFDTIRYLGVEREDALRLSEQTDC